MAVDFRRHRQRQKRDLETPKPRVDGLTMLVPLTALVSVATTQCDEGSRQPAAMAARWQRGAEPWRQQEPKPGLRLPSRAAQAAHRHDRCCRRRAPEVPRLDCRHLPAPAWLLVALTSIACRMNLGAPETTTKRTIHRLAEPWQRLLTSTATTKGAETGGVATASTARKSGHDASSMPCRGCQHRQQQQ